jgi:hypothetical protein
VRLSPPRLDTSPDSAGSHVVWVQARKSKLLRGELRWPHWITSVTRSCSGTEALSPNHQGGRPRRYPLRSRRRCGALDRMATVPVGQGPTVSRRSAPPSAALRGCLLAADLLRCPPAHTLPPAPKTSPAPYASPPHFRHHRKNPGQNPRRPVPGSAAAQHADPPPMFHVKPAPGHWKRTVKALTRSGTNRMGCLPAGTRYGLRPDQA